MKKIGLATCFINNYGACLQAYALQTVLEQYAQQVEIIQYLEPAGYNNSSLLRRLVLNPAVKRAAALLMPGYGHRLAFRNACERFKRQYLHFGGKKYFTYAELKENPPACDAFVCGSDQIWNPTFYGEPNKAYYLDFAGDKKRIAYAPSIGVSEIDAQYRQEFVRLVSRFDFLSVREKTGSLLIEKYCHRHARPVLDPTLLIDGAQWKEMAEKTDARIKGKYIFCYLFGDRPFYYDYIKRVGKKLGLPAYIIPFTDGQARAGFHNVYGAGPMEFVRLIRDASFVITDSFHATAFSINMNVPFYTLLRNQRDDPKGMNSRIYDILSLTGLEERLWEDAQDFSRFAEAVDWDLSNALLDEERGEGRAYLENALNS